MRRSGKPALCSLNGDFILTNKISEDAALEENILTLKARNWHNPEELVKDYFETNTTYFNENGKIVYQSIIDVINKLAKSVPAKLQNYYAKMSKYLSQIQKKIEFLSYYEVQLLTAKKEKQSRLIAEQSEIAGQVLTRKSIVNIEKRALEEIDQNRENASESSGSNKKQKVVITKNSKVYNIHSSGSIILPSNTPRIQKEDYDALKDDFDIKYRTTVNKSTPEAESIFKRSEEEEEENVSLRKTPGAIGLLKNTVLSKKFGNYKLLRSFDIQSSFIRVMQHIISDYYQNCLRTTPYDFNDERTFFCEVVIPILKSFALNLGNLTFKWCEKESAVNKSTWLHEEDYNLKKTDIKLLDGYGLDAGKTFCILVESSGSGKNVAHSVEDSIKQLKNSTDFLSYLMNKYRHTSADTFTRLKISSMLVIQNQLTLTVTSKTMGNKWQVIDVRTTVLPITRLEKNQMVKLFELLAKLKEIVDEQKEVNEQLALENVGLVPVESETNDT
ncbi:hypothetical protein G6F56_002431 [Rhizopus delemar]|nr:hypothetical protein G6F56_002431 [Rhizopus delemar]